MQNAQSRRPIAAPPIETVPKGKLNAIPPLLKTSTKQVPPRENERVVSFGSPSLVLNTCGKTSADESLSLRKFYNMGIADKLFQLKKEKAAANLQAGQAFLEANQQKPGVVTLPSGLQYEILQEGTGEKPSATSDVTCHYHGTLIDGTVFDSSVQRGQPATFPLNRVIKGWTEGLQLMGTGAKWRFFIPPHLGYGEQQVSAQIGPNSTLIFDVELLKIK